jgi:hypothetical protein
MLRKATPERVSTFSDAVFAVLITVLVLELRPPSLPTYTGLLALWPRWLSYAVSYLFIAIVWANHHYLMRFAKEATARLLWFNFAHLFSMSLLPLSTAWMATSELAPAGLLLRRSLHARECDLCRAHLGAGRSRQDLPGRAQSNALAVDRHPVPVRRRCVRCAQMAHRRPDICIGCLVLYLRPEPFRMMRSSGSPNIRCAAQAPRMPKANCARM